MLNSLTQEVINEYASNAQTIAEPLGADWAQGVHVGKTIPAKWWNWLFRATTRRIEEARSDADNMLTELKNTVVDAGLTPDPADNTQLAQAANILAVRGVSKYVQDRKKGFFGSWTSEVCEGFDTQLINPETDTVEIAVLKPADNSNRNAYCLCLKRTRNSAVRWLYFTSTDLFSWHYVDCISSSNEQAAPRTVDFAYSGETYYLLLSVDGDHTAVVYKSQDAAAWVLDRSFNEYGAVGLRVLPGNTNNSNDVLWMISATSQTYADIDYNSYYKVGGSNSTWQNAGTVFRNTGNTIDAVGKVMPIWYGFILGNKVTIDSVNWSQITTEWVNSAYSELFFVSSVVLMQFSSDEGAWYIVNSLQGAPIKKLGSWILKKEGPGRVLASDASGTTAAITTDGDTFTILSIPYPSAQDAEFFMMGTKYVLGTYISDNLTDWSEIELPVGAGTPKDSGVSGYAVAGNYFSSDECETWIQGISAGVAYCAVPQQILSNATCFAVELKNGVVLRHITFNGINRVIGTTLYLK